jgi:hypothetical protein
MIRDCEYVAFCNELFLSDTILLDKTIARTLVGMAEGYDVFELSPTIKGDQPRFSM